MNKIVLHTEDPQTKEAPDEASQDAGFSYTYSAQQNKEIERIRAKYIPPEENKMAQLRRLDKLAERQGTIVSICIGLLSTMLLGIGMVLTMVYIRFFALGIVIGIVGLVGVVLTYPLYQHITKKNREKIAPEILRLSEELLNGKK